MWCLVQSFKNMYNTMTCSRKTSSDISSISSWFICQHHFNCLLAIDCRSGCNSLLGWGGLKFCCGVWRYFPGWLHLRREILNLYVGCDSTYTTGHRWRIWVSLTVLSRWWLFAVSPYRFSNCFLWMCNPRYLTCSFCGKFNLY